MAICLIGMCFTLLLQGAYFFARDSVTPNLPRMFIVSDFCWFLMLISLAAWKRWPNVTLGMNWLGLAVIAAITQPNAQERTIAYFLLSNGLLIAAVALATANSVLASRKARVAAPRIS